MLLIMNWSKLSNYTLGAPDNMYHHEVIIKRDGHYHLKLFGSWSLDWQFARFTKRAPPCGWLRKGQNAHCIMGKCRQTNARARYEITHEHVSNDLKMWIKRLHTEIHIIITIYIHYKSIYFKIITCIILGLVNSNVFACKTNSAFNDFVDSCVTGKHNRTGARAL